MEIKLKSAIPYQPKFQTYFVVYGIDSIQSDVQSSVYDALYYVDNGKVVFNETVDMNDKLIIGLKNADRDEAAVNLKQVTDLLNNTLQALISQIDTKQNKNYYNEVFEYYFDLQNPDSFDMENSYGSNIESVGGKLILENTISLIDYDVKQGFSIDKSHIQLDNILDQNSDFTLFMSFLHDNSFKGTDYFIGLGNNVNPSFIVHFKPYIMIRNNKFLMRSTAYAVDYEEDILSAYQNKHLMLWFCKQGNTYKAIICQGGHINETIVLNNFQSNRVVIHLPYKVQRIGFSETFYNVYDKEFHKISFLEKSNGTYFI